MGFCTFFFSYLKDLVKLVLVVSLVWIDVLTESQKEIIVCCTILVISILGYLPALLVAVLFEADAQTKAVVQVECQGCPAHSQRSA